MKNKLMLYLGVVVLLVVACKSKSKTCCEKHESVSENILSSIEIGNYGGFAGTKESYTLYSDGNIISHYSLDTMPKYASIDAKETKELFATYKELKLMDYSYSKTGNMTFFIEYRINSKVNMIKWENQDSIDNSILNVYQSLYNKMQGLKFAKSSAKQ